MRSDRLPKTQAGRLLLGKNSGSDRDPATVEWLLNDILAIEREAALPEPSLEAAERLDALWADMLLDACASDGPIRDNDVREAMKRGRPKIEEAARDEGQRSCPMRYYQSEDRQGQCGLPNGHEGNHDFGLAEAAGSLSAGPLWDEGDDPSERVPRLEATLEKLLIHHSEHHAPCAWQDE